MMLEQIQTQLAQYVSQVAHQHIIVSISLF